MSFNQITFAKYIAHHEENIKNGKPGYTGLDIMYMGPSEIKQHASTQYSGVAQSKDGKATYHDVRLNNKKFTLVASNIKMSIIGVNATHLGKFAKPKKDGQTSFKVNVPNTAEGQHNDVNTIEACKALKYLSQDINELIAKNIKDGKYFGGDKVYMFYKDTYSRMTADMDKWGKPKEVPTIDITIKLCDLETQPAEDKTPYCKIHNYELSTIVEKDGKKIRGLGPAKFNNESIISDNFNKFLTRNSLITYMAIMPRVSQSNQGVTCSAECSLAEIKHIPGGTNDTNIEIEIDEDEYAAITQLQQDAQNVNLNITPSDTSNINISNTNNTSNTQVKIDPSLQQLFNATTQVNSTQPNNPQSDISAMLAALQQNQQNQQTNA